MDSGTVAKTWFYVANQDWFVELEGEVYLSRDVVDHVLEVVLNCIVFENAIRLRISRAVYVLAGDNTIYCELDMMPT
jgi:hypothetical protein